MNARDIVSDPIVLSPDEPGLPRLQFVALDVYVPRGVVTNPARGVAVHSFPSFAELVGQYSDREGQLIDLWWCITRMPIVGTDFELLAACIDSAPESLFQVLSGRDYGDALAGVVMRDWPDIYSMLEASTAGDLNRRLLAVLDNGQGRQWMVADIVVGEARHHIPNAQFEDLILTALSVAVRTNDWITTLPGILELGTDFATRRLEAIAGVFSGVADIGGGIQSLALGSLNPQALAAAMDAASNLPGHVRSIFH